MPGKSDVVWLEVPADAPDAAKTRLPNGKNYGFAVTTCTSLPTSSLPRPIRPPPSSFSIVKLPLNDINVQNGLMNKGAEQAGGRGTSCRRLAKGHEALVNDH